MAGEWEQIQRATWDDPAFDDLGPEAKLLFIWGWTNPRANVCGLYRATKADMQRALVPYVQRVEPGFVPGHELVESALTQLAIKPMMLYDEGSQFVWVVNRVKYANRNPQVARMMQAEVCRLDVPESLMLPFLERYGAVLDIRPAEQREAV